VVYVTGQNAGITGFVKRTGTAGDVLAPMVADPLCTHADAARARGGAILGAAGTVATVSVEVPMLENIGLIRPGALVEIAEGAASFKALTRSTTVSATWDRALKVSQLLELERHT
jgi:hypothetical protein